MTTNCDSVIHNELEMILKLPENINISVSHANMLTGSSGVYERASVKRLFTSHMISAACTDGSE